MKKIIYLCVLLIIGATSCTKKFDDLNTNPSRLTNPDPEPVMTQVFKMTADRSATENYNTFWEFGHLIEPTGQRYNAADDALWADFYMTGIGNLRQLKKIYDGNLKYTNRIAIANIWDCYLYAYLVGTYGPIPYSKAGITDPHISYDDENAIYTSLLDRLKQASETISGNLNGDKLTTDVIYGGDLTKWLKFANSLRLKIALNCQRNIPGAAIPAIQEVMSNEANLLQSDADAPKLTYGTAEGSQSAYFNKYVRNAPQSGNFPIMSDYVFTYFRSYKDPRMAAYFNKAALGYPVRDTLTSAADNLHHIVTYPVPYCGAPKSGAVLSGWGVTSNVMGSGKLTDSYSTLPGVNQKAVTSTAGINLVAADRPFYFMTYAELCFMKAEAAQLGYAGNTGTSAENYYYAGINANFAFWGLSPAQAAAYEAQGGIKWGTSARGFNYAVSYINTNIPADNMTKIWLQQWVNYFVDGGFDAWCLFRRTQFVVLPPHTNPGTANLVSYLYGDLPDRFAYATTETASNPLGLQDGIKLLGGPDYATTQLKFAKPYSHIDWNSIRVILDYSMMQKWYGTTVESVKAAGVTPTEISKY
jgi:hypothetical protein